MQIIGNRLYLLESSPVARKIVFSLVDISNRTLPGILGWKDYSGTGGTQARFAVDAAANKVYAGSEGIAKLLIFDITNPNSITVSTPRLNEVVSPQDVKVDNDYIYIIQAKIDPSRDYSFLVYRKSDLTLKFYIPTMHTSGSVMGARFKQVNLF